ncbi:MAG: hypothetical protein JNL73_03665 [Anaerolineales bacterium]|nr:hypothetical protein [Anaerolineales bacterium]
MTLTILSSAESALASTQIRAPLAVVGPDSPASPTRLLVLSPFRPSARSRANGLEGLMGVG